jgi:hypothetical protein
MSQDRQMSTQFPVAMGDGRCRESSILPGDEVHHPTQDYRSTDKKHKAVKAVAKHPGGRGPLGDAEDHRSEERKENNRSEMVGTEH